MITSQISEGAILGETKYQPLVQLTKFIHLFFHLLTTHLQVIPMMKPSFTFQRHWYNSTTEPIRNYFCNNAEIYYIKTRYMHPTIHLQSIAA